MTVSTVERAGTVDIDNHIMTHGMLSSVARHAGTPTTLARTGTGGIEL